MDWPASVEHIEITDQMGRQPKLAGRRITVSMIASWHLKQGMTVAEIAAEHDVTLGEVHAALAYYFDHRAAIEAQRAEIDRAALLLRAELPRPLTQARPASG